MLRRVSTRLQMMKQAAHQSQPGQFDKSFEKMVNRIENSGPRMKLTGELTNGGVREKDQWYGDIPNEELKKQAQQDLWGKEEPTIADQRRSIMFDAEDWRQRVNDTLQRARKLRATQPAMDPKILKTTKEPSEYYYPEASLEEKILYRRKLMAVSLLTVGIFVYWLRGALMRARSSD
jgi:hypothetical protein